MLKIENLVTEYGAVRALDGISFTAVEGKITTVIGANGAGKSMLLKLEKLAHLATYRSTSKRLHT